MQSLSLVSLSLSFSLDLLSLVSERIRPSRSSSSSSSSFPFPSSPHEDALSFLPLRPRRSAACVPWKRRKVGIRRHSRPTLYGGKISSLALLGNCRFSPLPLRLTDPEHFLALLDTVFAATLLEKERERRNETFQKF